MFGALVSAGLATLLLAGWGLVALVGWMVEHVDLADVFNLIVLEIIFNS